MNMPALKFEDDLLGDSTAVVALPPPQEEFCQMMAATGNIAASYRHAFGKQDLAANAAWMGGTRYLAKPEVQARVDELRRQALSYAHVTPGKIIQEMSKIAFFDIRKMLDDKGNLLPVHQLDDATAAGIAGIEMDVKDTTVTQDIYHDDGDEVEVGRANETRTTTRTVKVKLADKTKALDSLAKLVGIAVDKVEHTGANGAPLIPQDNEIAVARKVAFLLSKGMLASEAANG